MKRKIVAALAAAAMLCASVVGCGGEKKPSATTDGKSFTYWTVMDASSSKTLESYGDMMYYQELEKRTGVHIDFIHPIQGSTGQEAFIAMLSGAEIPDMIEYNWSSYTGGPQQALDDDVIVALNDYLEEYAPNYYDYMEGEKGKAEGYRYMLEATTDDGRYYGFNVLSIGETKGFMGIYTRADLLEKWGMEIPETIDDWTAVFAKAKAEGFSRPFTSSVHSLSFGNANSHTFNTAYGVGKNFYLEGDKVVFAPFQPGYKEYIAQLADWSSLGYIDSNFITNDSAKIESNMTNGISMTTHGYTGGGIGKILPAAQAIDPTYDLVACPYPVAKKGQIAEFQEVDVAAKPTAIGISTTCGNYEKAIQWCDYVYSDEGVVLQLFGIEGDTFTIEEREDGIHYVYTEKITDLEANGFNSVTDALYHYMLPCNHPGYNQHTDYLNGYYQYERQTEALITWNISAEKAMKHKLPSLGFTVDESREITDISEIAYAELEADLCDIIVGRKSIDEYDNIIEKAKANGYDRWLEIQQTAYDRFLAKANK